MKSEDEARANRPRTMRQTAEIEAKATTKTAMLGAVKSNDGPKRRIRLRTDGGDRGR